jgi:allantoinase
MRNALTRRSWVGVIAGLLCLLAQVLFERAFAQDGTDLVTKFPRDPVHVAAWPGGKKVAVSFALFVEVFGFGQGPVLRPDLAARNPDLVNEAFRQYAITEGNLRVARLFKELDVPLDIVLNAAFPVALPSVWKEFRAIQPQAPIIAHGMNNSNDILPLGRGLVEQKAYIRARSTSSPQRPARDLSDGQVRASIPMATPCRQWPARGSLTRSIRWILTSFRA